jgi:hypothetical protein
MNDKFPPRGGSTVQAWELRCGDYIKVSYEGAQITAHITQIDRGPDHVPGGEGVDWDGVYPGLDHDVLLPHGHAEFGPYDRVVRVWSDGLTAA